MHKRLWLSKSLLLLAVVLLILGTLLHYKFGYFLYDQSGHAWGADDAYISYRYAQNLSLGYGLVFNPGERVEGYSNLLFVLAAWLFLSAGVPPASLYLAITLLNLIFAIGLVLTFYKLAVTELDETKASLGALILSLSPVLWIWTSAGLEIPLVVLLQILIWISVNSLEIRGSRFYAGIWIAATLLLCLTRADGFVFPAISLVFLGFKSQRRLFFIFLFVLLLIVGILTAWRLLYYGQLLPNTYYVKVSGPLEERFKIAAVLLAYIAVNQGFLGYFSTIVHSIYTVFRESYRKRQPLRSKLGFETFASVLWIAYWFIIGGGTYLERFLVILIPLSIFSMLRLIRHAKSIETRIVVAVFLLLQAGIILIDPRFDYSVEKYDRWVNLGNYFKDSYPGKVIAVDAVGKISFFSGLKTIDMLGLNDPHISKIDPKYFSPGHNKFDPDYILDQKPDLISTWIANCPEFDCNWLDLSYGLTEEKYIQGGYTLAYLIYTGNSLTGEWLKDVSQYEPQAKLELIDQGYKYAVLVDSGQN